ncbi:hypothetical protein [Serratia sp. MF2]|uniref:hypothetical protein n=1 Tax=Serratia sp. MF2 TaxID=3059173 RepID=UPI0027FAF1C1|nr:hypothetical protein [Serratia sp. MF2]MDQ7101914.1 hypothetical protein [Serratia sp. MF2]
MMHIQKNTVPNSGKAVCMRNKKTGAVWAVSYDHLSRLYWHEPQGNLKNMRRTGGYASYSVDPRLEFAGTH